MPQSRPLHLFISYAHEDDPYRQELETHLVALKRQGLIEIWSDRAIEAGQDWEKRVSEQLEAADIILLLISSDFLASEYIYDKELKRAVERHNASQARVIPIFLRPCDWKGAPFGKLQGVPDNAKPISQWRNRDEALARVTRAVRQAVGSVGSSEPNSSPDSHREMSSAGALRKPILSTVSGSQRSRAVELISVLLGLGAIIGMVVWLWGKPQSTITTYGPSSPVVKDTVGDVEVRIGPLPPSEARP